MNSHHRFIYVVPMGDIGDEYLNSMAESIEEQFGLPVKVTVNQGLPSYALDAGRQQYNSNLILKSLIDNAAPDALKILGVTNGDLFNPIFAFVFGEAQFKGKGAVISSFRLRGNPDSESATKCPPLISRLEKEAIHELGHTFGLKHCADPDCVMQFSVGVECADRKFSFFCPACRELMLWHLGTDLFLRA
ncbi:MAG: archaemetzincin family Zn-dependent metalloprotease [Deltaproteobacteria bacterium]|nr:MAG: archaemetzincin family Zn-dependent metalloprotease [Deltaproteobacteria bacterium]